MNISINYIFIFSIAFYDVTILLHVRDWITDGQIYRNDVIDVIDAWAFNIISHEFTPSYLVTWFHLLKLLWSLLN